MGGLVSALNRKYRRQISKGIFPLCYLCGELIRHQNEVSQDHLICRCAGGRTIKENLSVAHKVCNNKRGAMTVQQWFDRQRN